MRVDIAGEVLRSRVSLVKRIQMPWRGLCVRGLRHLKETVCIFKYGLPGHTCSVDTVLLSRGIMNVAIYPEGFSVQDIIAIASTGSCLPHVTSVQDQLPSADEALTDTIEYINYRYNIGVDK